jgi:chaperonin GroEL
MSMSYHKVKSVAKQVEAKGERLSAKILKTMKLVSDVVGATLGPGGQPVLIERQELNMPNMVTKDGVTVFRSLGFEDSVSHCIMEAARDAAVRTASEAGDGTTTATILAEAIVRLTNEYCARNPRVSPQRVVRRLESLFRYLIEPAIKEMSLKVDMSTEEGKKLLWSVAKISANGDSDLADAVMHCFDIVGDEGNVTIMEISGPSHYEVEQIKGYPIQMGYEESCAKFYPKFINDPGQQRCYMEKPVFVIYHGRITEIQTVVMLMEKIGLAWQERGYNHNVVLIATGFSESVLGQLALNFAEATTINVFPLLAPQSPLHNGQLSFLQDIAAVTGARIFDPISAPLETAELDELGPSVISFEANRFRSNIIGHADEDLILLRMDELKTQQANAESILDGNILTERIGKLTGGIAKLKVIGASNGELREKRDRAEDAVCAVRGAIKHGCLPGGGWMLLKLADELLSDGLEPNSALDPVISQVLCPALFEPVRRLFSNVGVEDAEAIEILKPITESLKTIPFYKSISPSAKILVYDALEGLHVDAFEVGILDSTPAVLEAIRNSISIASLLGTLGGAVVFGRDVDLERQEARDTNEWVRNANVNPADERG